MARTFRVVTLLLSALLLCRSVSSATDHICNNVAWGSFTSPVYDATTIAQTVALDAAIGRSSQIVHYYLNWDDGYQGNNPAAPDLTQWTDLQRWLANARSFTSVGLSQHVPLISWQPQGQPYGVSNNKFSFSSIAAGTFNSYVDSFARVMKSLDSTVYVRFAHEFDGNWYPWGAGVNGNTAEKFKEAWRLVWTRVTNIAPKVQFVWCPNNSNTKSIRFEDYYPGDQYVSWLCLDAYASDSSASFGQTITTYASPAQPYQRLTALSPDKPIMIAEFGVNNKKAGSRTVGQWYQDMAGSLPNFPRIKAVVHFNVEHSDQSWKLNLNDQTLTSQVKSAFGCNGGITALTSWGAQSVVTPTPPTSGKTTGTTGTKTTGTTSRGSGASPPTDVSPNGNLILSGSHATPLESSYLLCAVATAVVLFGM